MKIEWSRLKILYFMSTAARFPCLSNSVCMKKTKKNRIFAAAKQKNQENDEENSFNNSD
jgi:hypothetical protein